MISDILIQIRSFYAGEKKKEREGERGGEREKRKKGRAGRGVGRRERETNIPHLF